MLSHRLVSCAAPSFRGRSTPLRAFGLHALRSAMRPARPRGTVPAVSSPEPPLDAAAAGSPSHSSRVISDAPTSREIFMARAMLVGLLMLLPLGAVSRADDWAPAQCEAFDHNMDGAFDVAPGGQYRVTIDMTHCGGYVQNYQVTLMGAKRGTPY